MIALIASIKAAVVKELDALFGEVQDGIEHDESTVTARIQSTIDNVINPTPEDSAPNAPPASDAATTGDADADASAQPQDDADAAPASTEAQK